LLEEQGLPWLYLWLLARAALYWLVLLVAWRPYYGPVRRTAALLLVTRRLAKASFRSTGLLPR
jgi:hypothetical protein